MVRWLAAAEAAFEDLPEVLYETSDNDDDEIEEEPVFPIARAARQSSARKHRVQPLPESINVSIGVKSPIVPEPVKKEIKPKVDTSGVTVGATVQHKLFGNGKVDGFRNNLITVEFENGKKDFEFPGAFDAGFLKFVG